MNREKIVQAVAKMNCALQLERKIVGVKFLFNKEDFQAADAKHITNKMNYCVMVKVAMNGTGLKACGDDLVCIAGGRTLGLIEIDDFHRSGQNGKNLGIYRHMTTAKNIRDRMCYCTHKAYGVMVKPLEDYAHEPDVVLMVTNPYNIMRILQGYSYFYGMHSTYQMVGNQGICSESTALPYMSNNINVSMLCIGTRHKAGWKDNELAIGIPFNRFQTLSQGVMDTINIMDNNEKKAVIEKKLKENNIDELEIKYNCNYYY
ncbi:DUF169 domain-containing protein [Anaeromicrobium sediminis]|uniref:DUF169 domain-containing protein n=1 Tax=Anaeromicrobium sediminis TaxID=1478221 RepID=A0A267MJ69_9FIRM|nr:DUF169 domain-containing protein [Anaeromicrobium sediminis]PAB59576.1 hypothetical protein CCE28_10215 [Anaeromicrobium sediminis]